MRSLVGDRVRDSNDLADLVKKLKKLRAVWLMLPAGEITENTVKQLGGLLEPGDTIIDGGNAFFQDDVRRAKAMKRKGIHYVDCGTSGGVWGLERGYCLMIGGEKEVVARPHLRRPVTGRRQDRQDALSREPRSTRRARLSLLWALGFGPLREDDP